MSEVVISDPEKKKRPRLAWILISMAVVAIAAGAGLALRALQPKDKDPAPTGELRPLQEAVANSQNRALSGNYLAAHAELEKALKKDNLSNQERFELLYQQGATYDNEKKYEQALASYKEAAALQETQNVYVSMALTAKSLGDKTQAIAYYKKAIQLISPKNPIAEDDKRSYEQEIRDLGGQP